MKIPHGLRVRMLTGSTCASVLLAGCSAKPAPAPAMPPPLTAKAAQSSSPPVEADPILPESKNWTREEAVARLWGRSIAVPAEAAEPRAAPADLPDAPQDDDRADLDEDSESPGGFATAALEESAEDEDASPPIFGDPVRVSAAVRLVRLAAAQVLSVPDPLPPRVAQRLRVARLCKDRFAIGFGESAEDPRGRLISPALIDSRGDVALPAEGIEEELARLQLADDPDVFPHLLITPRQVLIVSEKCTPALVAKDLHGLRWELRRKNGYPYVALVWPGELPPASAPASQSIEAQSTGDDTPPSDPERDPHEIARYTWDPFESAFMGPAADKVPGGDGGRFELDLHESKALIPVGGDLPELPVEGPPKETKEDEPPPF